AIGEVCPAAELLVADADGVSASLRYDEPECSVTLDKDRSARIGQHENRIELRAELTCNELHADLVAALRLEAVGVGVAVAIDCPDDRDGEFPRLCGASGIGRATLGNGEEAIDRERHRCGLPAVALKTELHSTNRGLRVDHDFEFDPACV